MKYLLVATTIFMICYCPGRNICGKAAKVYKDNTATQFFQRTTGWIASDGALSVPLSDGRTLWLMGDSHIDDYDTTTGSIPCLFQVRNAALLQPSGDWKPSHTRTLIGKGPGIKSFLKTTADDNYWIWPGTGIQLGDTVYLYCSELKRTGEGTWGFAATGKDLWAKIKFPEMEIAGYGALPDFEGINFGAGFIKDEKTEYVYAYGQKLIPMTGESKVYIARFSAANPGAHWKYWDGRAWNNDVTEIRSIGRSAISPHVSKLKDKYLLLSTQLSVACDQGKEIYFSVSEQATGPFNGKKLLYTIDDTLQGHYPFFYSVAAHPEFSGAETKNSLTGTNLKEDLLVTYCINGYAPFREPCLNGRADPDHYRPRGIRVPLNLIIPEGTLSKAQP